VSCYAEKRVNFDIAESSGAERYNFVKRVFICQFSAIGGARRESPAHANCFHFNFALQE
jgi:hypothetical protein